VHFQNRPLLERNTCVIFDHSWTHAGK
jgi:hypothetical protein